MNSCIQAVDLGSCIEGRGRNLGNAENCSTPNFERSASKKGDASDTLLGLLPRSSESSLEWTRQGEESKRRRTTTRNKQLFASVRLPFCFCRCAEGVGTYFCPFCVMSCLYNSRVPNSKPREAPTMTIVYPRVSSSHQVKGARTCSAPVRSKSGGIEPSLNGYAATK